MELRIRRGPHGDKDLPDLLLDCHERIRRFSDMAEAAGEQLDAPEDEVIEACARAERYFREALPRHVADEEESILPRLRGRSAEIDAALETMRAQHADHDAKLRELLSASEAVRERPADAERRARLLAAARELKREFDEHLEMEERVIIPAVRTLEPDVVEEIRAEMRARRR